MNKTFKRPEAYDYLTDDQRNAFDAMLAGTETGENFFLTGNAGTGKSFLANVYADACRMNGLMVAKAAPTGIAAVNIGGTTLHSLFKLNTAVAGPNTLEKTQLDNLRKALIGVDVLFIDEISMARVDQLDCVLRQVYRLNQIRKLRYTGRTNPTQVIVCGDFGQLPPVVTDSDRKIFSDLYEYAIGSGFCFTGAGWKHMKFKNLVLTETVRQTDDGFCDALDKIRLGDRSGADYIIEHSSKEPIPDAIWICGKNKTVQERNQLSLNALDTPLHKSKAVIVGKAKISDTNLEEYLEFKQGARVIMLANEPHGLYCNGSMGTIRFVDGRCVGIKLDDGLTVEVYPTRTEFKEHQVEDGVLKSEVVGTITQYPFKLGYAMTIHKSQGQTFSAMNLIPEVFCDGQLYVALSRCKDVSKLYIQPDANGVRIRPRDIRADAQMKTFMTGVLKDNAVKALASA